MKRCLDLAEKAKGYCYPNPMVGAVVVHEGIIIGEGYHQKAGLPHAEINAINSVKDQSLLRESTIYVSLEPCAHYGKTPPCAEKIIEIGFKKVVIGATDSHTKVNGKGKKMIEEAGIEVVSGILENQCLHLNKRFFTFHQKKRPYIILKWAQSGDKLIDQKQQPTLISNALSKQFVHQLRSEEHAILVGANTAIHDNPSLTTREIAGRNPIRILIDPNLRVDQTYRIYNNEAPTLVVNTQMDEEKDNIQYLKVSKDNFLEEMMEKLQDKQIQSILVEGGSITLQQFIDAGLWDETIIIKNEDLLLKEGTPAPKLNKTPIYRQGFRNNTIEFYKNS